MKHLLAINVYDKQGWVDAWLRQFEKLDRDRWALEIVCNGPRPRAGWTVAQNPEQTGGYKLCLLATRPSPEIDVVVSVHAKTVLNDIALLDGLVDKLLESDADAIFTDRHPYFWTVTRDNQTMIVPGPPFGEFLFLFAVRAPRWNDMTSAFAADIHGKNIGTEVGLAQVIDRQRLKVLRSRASGPIVVTFGELAVFGFEGLNVYGCEKEGSDRFSSEHWLSSGVPLAFDEIRRRDVDAWFTGV